MTLIKASSKGELISQAGRGQVGSGHLSISTRDEARSAHMDMICLRRPYQSSSSRSVGDDKLEPFFLEEPEAPPGENPAKAGNADKDDWISQLMSDLNLPYEELEAKLQRQIAQMQVSEKPEPTEKSMLEEDERMSSLMSHLDPPDNCLELRYKKPIVPRKLRGTLTPSNSNSVYTSVFPIVLYRSYTMATPKHRDPFQLGNYLRIIAFAPGLRRGSFYS
jgi:hypothetical protein